MAQGKVQFGLENGDEEARRRGRQPSRKGDVFSFGLKCNLPCTCMDMTFMPQRDCLSSQRLVPSLATDVCGWRYLLWHGPSQKCSALLQGSTALYLAMACSSWPKMLRVLSWKARSAFLVPFVPKSSTWPHLYKRLYTIQLYPVLLLGLQSPPPRCKFYHMTYPRQIPNTRVIIILLKIMVHAIF